MPAAKRSNQHRARLRLHSARPSRCGLSDGMRYWCGNGSSAQEEEGEDEQNDVVTLLQHKRAV